MLAAVKERLKMQSKFFIDQFTCNDAHWKKKKIASVSGTSKFLPESRLLIQTNTLLWQEEHDFFNLPSELCSSDKTNFLDFFQNTIL